MSVPVQSCAAEAVGILLRDDIERLVCASGNWPSPTLSAVSGRRIFSPCLSDFVPGATYRYLSEATHANNMSVVICKIPKAGLGNQLFPLMRARLFAHLYNLPILVTGYRQVRLGMYLRNEKINRNYNNYFRFQKNIFQYLGAELRMLTTSRSGWIKEPELSGN